VKHLKTFNESIPFNSIYFTKKDVDDISDVFTDISDEYCLKSEHTGRHGIRYF